MVSFFNIVYLTVLVIISMTNIENIQAWKCTCGEASNDDEGERHSQNGEPSHGQLVFDDSLCSYEKRIHYDRNRVPSEITYAKLMNNQCQWRGSGAQINNETTQCFAVEANMNVTLNCGDEETSGCRTCLESYPVAFICGCRPSKSRQQKRRMGHLKTRGVQGNVILEPCA